MNSSSVTTTIWHSKVPKQKTKKPTTRTTKKPAEWSRHTALINTQVLIISNLVYIFFNSMDNTEIVQYPFQTLPYRLVCLVVRRPARERKIPGSNPACTRIFSGSSHTSDFKIGTPVATMPGAWQCRVSTGTGRPGVSIL